MAGRLKRTICAVRGDVPVADIAFEPPAEMKSAVETGVLFQGLLLPASESTEFSSWCAKVAGGGRSPADAGARITGLVGWFRGEINPAFHNCRTAGTLSEGMAFRAATARSRSAGE